MNSICSISGWAFISPLFRNRRINKFLSLFKPTSRTRILDVGGLPNFWHDVPIQSPITMLNLQPLDAEQRSFVRLNQQFAIGDGAQLHYSDQSFDIVFSNSVIEHLGTFQKQLAFAREARRVGKGYWIQTPAREFLIEPHYFTLFLHWFAKPVQRRLLKHFSLWGWSAKPNAALLDAVLAELRLLTRSEFASLFPGANIWTERLAGWPKSHVAYQLPTL